MLTMFSIFCPYHFGVDTLMLMHTLVPSSLATPTYVRYVIDERSPNTQYTVSVTCCQRKSGLRLATSSAQCWNQAEPTQSAKAA